MRPVDVPCDARVGDSPENRRRFCCVDRAMLSRPPWHASVLWLQLQVIIHTHVLPGHTPHVACLQSVKPDAPVSSSVLGGAFGGFFQAARATMLELSSTFYLTT